MERVPSIGANRPHTPAELSQPYSMEYNYPHRKGVVEKCIFCPHMLREGKLPECAAKCTMGAIYFGDEYEDAVTNSKGETIQLSKVTKQGAGFRLLEELGHGASRLLPACRQSQVSRDRTNSKKKKLRRKRHDFETRSQFAAFRHRDLVGVLCVDRGLSCVVLWGLYAYIHQLRQGLIVTGMRDQTSWGMYITDFVFFIGISHAGTLISAVLRVADAGWRRPITRLAEGITVFALCIGGPMVIIDMGRPDRMLNLFIHGRIQSPIFWDVLGVSTYLTGCIIYLYLPMIPDLAFLAKREEFSQWRRKLYRALSLGWTATS